MQTDVTPHIWHICHPGTVNAIKKFENNAGDINSDGLVNNGINFYFTLEFLQGTDGNDVAVIWLNLMHIPSFIRSFQFEYNINLKEANINKYLRSEFSKECINNNNRLCRYIMNKQDFKALNTFTFDIQLRVTSIRYDRKHHRQFHRLINLNTNVITLPKISYSWNIKSKQDVESFKSLSDGNFIVSDSFDVYGIKACLGITPHKNDNMLIFFAFISSFIVNNISKIQIFGKCYWVEEDREKSWTAEQTNKKSFEGILMKTADLLKHNRFTFVVEIAIVNVFDVDHCLLKLPTRSNHPFYECSDEGLTQFAVNPSGQRLRTNSRKNMLCEYCKHK